MTNIVSELCEWASASLILEAGTELVIRGGYVSLCNPRIVSYDARPEITRLHPDAVQIRYGLTYSANRERSTGSKVMFFSDNLTIPSLLPGGISASQVAHSQSSALAL